MGFPAIFALFTIIAILFNYRLKKISKEEAKLRDAYWEKERESLIVRKKQFEEQDFIRADIRSLSFPSIEFTGYEAKQYQSSIDKIKALAGKDMMNFSDLTNTEIRLRFGTANQTVIAANESNYGTFLKALFDYGHLLESVGEKEEAQKAYEICIAMKSEYSRHYTALALLYHEQQNREALHTLYETASLVDQKAHTNIVRKLDELQLM